MHELAVTKSILETACRHAEKAGARRVTMLRLVVGDLSSFVDDTVAFYWDIISKGTVCEGAKLEFQRVRARIVCEDCGKENDLERELLPCPDCGSQSIRVIGGDEFRLESMDIEEDGT